MAEDDNKTQALLELTVDGQPAAAVPVSGGDAAAGEAVAEPPAVVADPDTVAKTAAIPENRTDVSRETSVRDSDSGEDAKTVAIPDKYANDPVARRRIEHGLSPEPADSKEKADGGTASASAATRSDGSAPMRTFSKERRAQKEAEDRLKKIKRDKRIRTIRRTIIAILALVIIGVIAFFCYLRWGSLDDRTAIQGQWHLVGPDSNITITITDEIIALAEDVEYDYVIDPDSKTIAYTFGGMTGSGRYRLSLDGNILALRDGSYDWFGTLVGDVPWTLDAVLSHISGKGMKSPDLGEGGQLLVRVA